MLLSLRLHPASVCLLNKCSPSSSTLTSRTDKDSHNSECELRKREFYYVMRLFQSFDGHAAPNPTHVEKGSLSLRGLLLMMGGQLGDKEALNKRSRKGQLGSGPLVTLLRPYIRVLVLLPPDHGSIPPIHRLEDSFFQISQ